MGDYARAVRRLRNLLPLLPRDAWVVLAGHGLSAVGTGLTLPFLFVYLNQVRELDVGVAGLAVACIGAASLVGNPVGGLLSDRVGPRNTVVLGLVLSAVGATSLALVDAVWHAFAAAALVGLGASVTWPAEDSLLATVVRREQRSHAFAVRFALVNAGFGVGGLVAATFVDVDRPGTFTAIYLVDAASFLLYAPVLVLLLRPAPRPSADGAAAAAGGYRAVLRDKVFVRVWLLTAVVVTVGYGQYHSSFPAYATGSGGISARALGLVFAANTITVVVAQLVVLRLLGARRRTRAVTAVCGLWAATWAVTLVAGGLDGGALATGIFALAMILFAIGETLLPPSLPAVVNELASDELRGRYNGLYTLAWTTGFIVGPVVAGIAIGAGLSTGLFVGLVAACGLAAVGAMRLERLLPAAVNVVPVSSDRGPS